MIGPAAFRLATASSLLPASTALVTLLIAVRSLEREAMLWARLLMVWRARFSADLILATNDYLKSCPGMRRRARDTERDVQKRAANCADERAVRQEDRLP